jgi:hypothetical protein
MTEQAIQPTATLKRRQDHGNAGVSCHRNGGPRGPATRNSYTGTSSRQRLDRACRSDAQPAVAAATTLKQPNLQAMCETHLHYHWRKRCTAARPHRDCLAGQLGYPQAASWVIPQAASWVSPEPEVTQQRWPRAAKVLSNEVINESRADGPPRKCRCDEDERAAVEHSALTRGIERKLRVTHACRSGTVLNRARLSVICVDCRMEDASGAKGKY